MLDEHVELEEHVEHELGVRQRRVRDRARRRDAVRVRRACAAKLWRDDAVVGAICGERKTYWMLAEPVADEGERTGLGSAREAVRGQKDRCDGRDGRCARTVQEGSRRGRPREVRGARANVDVGQEEA